MCVTQKQCELFITRSKARRHLVWSWHYKNVSNSPQEDALRAEYRHHECLWVILVPVTVVCCTNFIDRKFHDVSDGHCPIYASLREWLRSAKEQRAINTNRQPNRRAKKHKNQCVAAAPILQAIQRYELCHSTAWATGRAAACMMSFGIYFSQESISVACWIYGVTSQEYANVVQPYELGWPLGI